MTYYRLRCETCGEMLRPVLATEPGELLVPDYEQLGDSTMGGQLRAFHERHAGHELVEEPVQFKLG